MLGGHSVSTVKFFLPILALACSSTLFSSCTTSLNFSKHGDNSKDNSSTKNVPDGKKTNGETSGPGTNPGGEPGASGEEPGGGNSSQPKPDSGGEPGPGGGAEPSGDCEEGEVDQNCHFLPDGSPIKFPKGLPVGNCKAGRRTCEDGSWGSCEGAIPPKEADDCSVPGDDSDCDGVRNGGCECTTGDVRDCGDSNVGLCKLGKQHCEDGVWSKECKGAVFKSPEHCDGKGLDEDCDGKADTDDKDCECINGAEKFCDRPDRDLFGDCRIGKRVCAQGKWQGCKEWAKPIDEVCGKRSTTDGVPWTGDEDCNGRADTSLPGRPGPAGCTPMMLDADRDGYGRKGVDLADISTGQTALLATACLCPNREDMDEKRSEGWTEFNGREYQDCGDCSHEVHPGSSIYTATANPCLSHTPWRAREGGIWVAGVFDMDCSATHDIAGNSREYAPIQCRQVGETMDCQSVGAGKLIAKGRIRCGRTYQYGQCYGITKKEKKKKPKGTGADDSSTGPDEEIEVFVQCGVKRKSQSVTIRCR